MQNTKAVAVTAIALGLTSFTSSAIEIYKDKENALSVGGFFGVNYLVADDYDELANGASRVNFEFTRELKDGWTAFAKAEWAVNLVTSNSDLIVNGDGRLSPGAADDTISTRLGYVGAKHDKWGSVSLGKQWGSIYNVTAPTDMLNAFGAEAAGSFNMGTDGGYTGAGRAEQAIQYNNTFGNLFVSVQMQATEENVEIDEEFLANHLPEAGIPGTIPATDLEITYDNSYGIAAIYALPFNLTAGLGYNIAELEVTSESVGMNETLDDTMTAASLTYGSIGNYGFYAAIVGSVTENHELDSEGRLIDATGLEAVVTYRFNNDIELLAAVNTLTADESDNDYEMSYYVAGIGYYWADDFKVYAEYKMDDSTNVDGSESSNGDMLAIGARYSF
ncbi:porin [Thalassotalea psychrophila]|uniref:Porin n=1 Tax=Thalassotalea psychrophila TaxID=3065647 RepID=A0ABY9TYQ1_9GAMM|nr:porin [Colwelliaceae bacterium SQ149]